MPIARDVAPDTLLSAFAVADLYHRSSDDIGWNHPLEQRLYDGLRNLPGIERLGFQLHHPHALVGFTPKGHFLFWVEYSGGQDSFMVDSATGRQYFSLQGVLKYISKHESSAGLETTPDP